MISKKYSLIVCAGCLLIYIALSFHDTDRQLKTISGADRIISPFKHISGFFRTIGQQSNIISDPTQPVSVLVLTYMRSGSSLTGDILQHSKEAFYVYEPFRSLGHKNASTFTLLYANGSERVPPFSFQTETYNALYNWFTCNISSLPNIGLMDGFLKKLRRYKTLCRVFGQRKARILGCEPPLEAVNYGLEHDKGLKSRMFSMCYRKEIHQGKEQKLAIRMCARQLQDICEKSPFRIIKTIRLQLHDIRNLLEDLPNLKIIHLVRDPRATLLSQSKLGVCSSWKGGQPGCTNKFCTRLENDVLAEEQLMKIYPNRIMPVFYKDIAKNPLKTSKEMYDFIGADFTADAETYIYNITMAGNENNCAICTTRSNSSEHVDEWKKKMKPEFIKLVNERCNYVIKRYNFDEFPVK